MGKLTALSVKAAKKPGKYYDGDGLVLVVKASGARSWIVRLQAAGKRRDFGLGSANDVSLAEARELAADLRKKVRSGIDPVEEKKKAAFQVQSVPTFRNAAKTVHQEHKGSWRNKKHTAQWLSSLEAYAYPHIGDLKVNTITAPMIITLLLPIWLDKPETARRVRQRIGTVLDWAHAKGYRETEAPMRSIARGLPKQPKKDRHFAAMPYDQVPELMEQLTEADSVGRLALRFLILTAARSGEVRGATWDEINLSQATWTVPGERMKAGKDHIAPLSPVALDILEVAAKLRRPANDHVFPGNRNKALSDMTLTKVLRDMHIEDATVHGFRSSFRDWAAEQTSTPGDIVEAALAHTIANRVEAAYRRTNYLEKRRPLMDAWAHYLTNQSTNVVSLIGKVT